MDFQHLQAYVAVATHRSISAAAQELGISQPALSRRIQSLERALGVRLLERGRRPLGLTSAGEAFLEFARQALAEWQAFIERLRVEPRQVRGRLCIAASTTPGEFLVPSLVAEFTRRYPGVEPVVDIMDTAAVVGCLRNRECDVGFLGAPLQDPRFRLIPVGEDEVVLAVPAGHPFAGRPAVRVEELAGQPVLMRERGSGTLQSLVQRLQEQGRGLPPLNVVMVLGSTQAILSAVRAGLGIGFVSHWALASRPAGEVRGVALEGVRLHRTLYMAYEEARLTEPLLRAFVQFVREGLHSDESGGGGARQEQEEP